VALVRRRRSSAEAQRRSAARRARTPAKKAAASSSVNPATGQTLVLDTTIRIKPEQQKKHPTEILKTYLLNELVF